ncbi:DUF6283 family protein [Streptosporangium sp. CA-135522]|uniref:DUF6283 family protein n=1 Tax=Streptosporangium sp. CA-135522 TaxID=3240072 RepID=UPI003D8D9BB5
MSTTEMPRRKFPCGECPWQVSAELGKFPAERYEELRATCQPNAAGVPPLPGTPMFGCHVGDPKTGEDLACAGWLAVEGFEHIGVRLALADGRIPASALQPGHNWPELYPSYEAMAEANGAMKREGLS